MERIDVAIVGAGAAGLAAAAELARRGMHVVVFEARSRIGGRIYTLRARGVPVPIELGAEFIHGDAEETERIVREAGLAAHDVAGEQWLAVNGNVRRTDFWRQIDRVLGKIDTRKSDRSFADFLRTQPGGRALVRARAAAREFVQGFHAADLEEISARSIAPDGDEGASDSAARLARVEGGYGAIARWLARDVAAGIRLRAEVGAISWERGRCELVVRRDSVGRRHETVRARAAVVTVPLGVLTATAGARGAIALHPDPPRIRAALTQLAVGSVTRLVVLFSELPWRKLPREQAARLARAGFLHTRGGPFNVWWSTYPVRSTVAVAWSGGPSATALGRLSRQQLDAAARDALGEALGITPRRIAALIERTWTHDWDRDPFSRGAYSYARPGGENAAAALAKPVDGTLFFAGEATHSESSGTVEGAIASGLRAARQVARALGHVRARAR